MSTHPHQTNNTCRERDLHNAKRVCEQKGLKFTHLRQQVYQILLDADKPIGAYDIISKLEEVSDREQVAPPTVYRTLEFFLNCKLVYRIHSLNAFLPRKSSIVSSDVSAIFVCQSCGNAQESPMTAVQQSLNLIANKLKFSVSEQSLELLGTCETCSQKDEPM